MSVMLLNWDPDVLVIYRLDKFASEVARNRCQGAGLKSARFVDGRFETCLIFFWSASWLSVRIGVAKRLRSSGGSGNFTTESRKTKTFSIKGNLVSSLVPVPGVTNACKEEQDGLVAHTC